MMKTTDGNPKKKRTVKRITAESEIVSIYKVNTQLTLVAALKGVYDRELDFKAYEAYVKGDKKTLFDTCVQLSKLADCSLTARVGEKSLRTASKRLLELKTEAWAGYKPPHSYLVGVEKGHAIYSKKKQAVKIDKGSKLSLGMSEEGHAKLRGKMKVPFSGKEISESEIPFGT
jgi:hypothetical protein